MTVLEQLAALRAIMGVAGIDCWRSVVPCTRLIQHGSFR
jgi:hypothetical protein